MTLDELNDTLDAMAEAAAGDPQQMPGLITINTDLWVKDLADMRAPCKAIHDGMRHRDVAVQVSSGSKTEVLIQAEAGDRGAPYRDLAPKD
ncbi:hypothetical protein [Brevundimonas sp.]|uniref:hypothetical protein n=1 Tax=Brevundimonas sp. TaxID=1871086 RepID=UPI003BABC809